MGECDICGENYTPAYTCNHCDATLCSDHRLPENHNCPAVRMHDSDSPVFQSDSPSTLGQTSDLTERRKGDKSRTDDSPDSMDLGTELPSAAKDPPSSPSPDVTKSGDIASGDSEAGHNWPKGGDDNDDGSRVRDAAGSLWGVLTTPSYYLIAILLCFTISATIGTGVPAVDNTTDTIIDQGGNAVNSLLSTVSSSAESGSESNGILSGPDNEINETRVERAAHRRINEIRTERGLNPLRWDGRLQSIAEGHSTDMATNDFFSHTSPEGENFEDRYAEAGYECRVPIDGNQYAVGGENIAYTYAKGDINTDHRGVVNYHNNETAIGRGVVNSWMHSSGHSENILQSYWQHEGIGVAVSGNKIYVTQNFC